MLHLVESRCANIEVQLALANKVGHSSCAMCELCVCCVCYVCYMCYVCNVCNVCNVCYVCYVCNVCYVCFVCFCMSCVSCVFCVSTAIRQKRAHSSNFQTSAFSHYICFVLTRLHAPLAPF